MDGTLLKRARYGQPYLILTWAFGLLSWGFAYNIVGMNVTSLRAFLAANALAASIFLLLILMCVFLRNEPGRAVHESSEDALTLCAVLVYPQEVAVALVGLAAMLVTLSQLASRRQRELELGPWYAYVGEIVFQGGLMAFAALTGSAVYAALYGGWEPLRDLGPGDAWRIPLVFASIYLIRLAVVFLHSWSRGLPLVEYTRSVRSLGSARVALSDAASLLLGVSMAIVYTRLGLDVFTALGGVLVAMIRVTSTEARTRRELLARVAELQVLHTVGRALGERGRTPAGVLEALNEQSLPLFNGERFDLYIAPDSELAAAPGPVQTGPLFFDAVGCASAETEADDREETSEWLARWCLRHQRALRIDNARRELNAYGFDGFAPGAPYASWLGVPLQVNSRFEGVLSVASRAPSAFRPQHTQLLDALGRQVVTTLQNARLLEIATLDALTGLLTSRYLRKRLAEEFALATALGRPFSIVMVDIDHFKRINDTYGHEVGNEVLRAVARAVSGRLRDSDVAARYGGEEFTVLLPGTPAPGAVEVAERLRVAMEAAPIDTAAGPVAITASFGVATYPSVKVADADALLVAADAALYDSKRAGRNRVTEARIA